MKRVLIIITAMLAAVFIAMGTACDGCSSCSDTPSGTGERVEIELSSQELTMDLLENIELTATTKQTLEDVSWTSDKPEIVSVTAEGKTAELTANALGTAVITATVDGVSATCTVTVIDRGSVAYIRLNNCESEITVFTGDDFTVSAAIIFQGKEQSGEITMESSDTGVITVEGNKLTAGKIGQAVVTLTGTHAGKIVKTYITVNVIPVSAG